jgi:glycosyltransferase involved in cell wall biosynthesis
VERLVALGVDRESIARIPHPLFAASPGDEVRTPNGHALLHFGLLRSAKGLDVLLRALPGIAAAVPDVRLVVAGDPLEPVEPLHALADELGVGGRVEWRLGYVREEQIPALMDEATAVVLPYRKIESSGVLATALGHGRPAVVTDVGSLGDTVREFGAGLVVSPEDPAELAAACIRLLTDAAALDDAFAGTARAREALTWEKAAEAHERLYEQVLAERG